MDISPFDVTVFLVLLLISGSFSGSESALTAVNRVRVTALAQGGNRTARILEHLLKDRSRMISTLLIGNNIVNVVLTVFATMVFINALPGGIDPAMAGVISSTVTVVFLLIFGEVIPKTVGVNIPLRVSLIAAWPIYVVQVVLTPLTLLLSGAQRLVLKMVGHSEGGEPKVTRADLKVMAELADKQDVIGAGGSEAIANLVDLHQTRAREVMTPRTDIEALPVSASFDDLVEFLKRTRYSRVPVYSGDIDDIVGIVNFREVVGVTRETFDLSELVRKATFVPEQKRLDQLMLEMRRTKTHVVVVVDEYGGTSGLLTLEDALEEVVGQIEDEFDDEALSIRKFREGIAFVDAACSLNDVQSALSIGLSIDEGVDNIAGLFLREFGKIPVEGDRIAFQDLDIIVNRMHGKRIRRFLVVVNTDVAETQGGAL